MDSYHGLTTVRKRTVATWRLMAGNKGVGDLLCAFLELDNESRCSYSRE